VTGREKDGPSPGRPLYSHYSAVIRSLGRIDPVCGYDVRRERMIKRDRRGGILGMRLGLLDHDEGQKEQESHRPTTSGSLEGRKKAE
jgi:hypothetical protein